MRRERSGSGQRWRMNSSNPRNIIIILVAGVVIIAAAYILLGRRNAPATSLDQPSQGMTFQNWYKEKSAGIEKGQAASVLSEVEAKLDPAQTANRDAGMLFAMFELRGDALVKLNRCEDAVESYELAAGNLRDAQFLFIRDDGKDPRDQMITDAERAAQQSRLDAKLEKARACAQ